MNRNKYDKFIGNYVSKIDLIYDEGHKEYYKWKAVAHCKANWNPEAENFGDMFHNAFRLSANLIEYSGHKPITGIVKLCDRPNGAQTVKEAFRKILSKAAPADKMLGEYMDEFITTVNEAISREPGCENMLQERQDIVMYLAFIEPERYFMFKPAMVRSFAEKMMDPAEQEEYAEASLTQCYEICAQILEALKRDVCMISTLDRMLTIQEERDGRVAGIYTKMPGKLNIMVYELLYSGEIYGLYNGIRRTTVRKLPERKPTPTELKREHYISEKNRLQELKERYERDLKGIEYPELNAVVVHSKAYGEGKIVSTAGTTIGVEFSQGIKKFVFPDCFTNGFITTLDQDITDLCDREALLRSKIKKVEGNITTVQGIISKLA